MEGVIERIPDGVKVLETPNGQKVSNLRKFRLECGYEVLLRRGAETAQEGMFVTKLRENTKWRIHQPSFTWNGPKARRGNKNPDKDSVPGSWTRGEHTFTIKNYSGKHRTFFADGRSLREYMIKHNITTTKSVKMFVGKHNKRLVRAYLIENGLKNGNQMVPHLQGKLLLEGNGTTA